ncbi:MULTISPECIES: aspartate ammonia-lyase [Anaerococcus]|uniref:aspartate ammonia-lyase n=1 Tax=Anaerococcus TaxID=165779 RepID=UPI001AE8D555|nr:MULTISPECIES: aspartate ammonia-lyase [Anaerococcus]MBP2070146.1 aspartate ammonia-lyase [Anaerococcus nagyae]MDU2354204.1 aspartate ammonia-lyase [Anaerococcus sp.]
MQDYRREHDSLGEVEVDRNAFYGANALRARENFNITGRTCDDKLIDAILEVKKACAIENEKIGLLTNAQKEAIISACNLLLGGSYRENFIVDPIQGGAGTSFNMNANEVIANMANQSLGGNLGVYDKVHPNDHVNKGQSTNDVIPTSGKIALIRYFKELYDENIKLINAIEDKADEFKEVYKMGRTQLQDAIPISLGQEFAAYARVLKRDNERFKKAIHSLSFVNLGGTAIGTGLNADKTYVEEIVPVLAEVTGLNLKQNEDLIDGTQNLDGFTYSSSILKTYASNLSKIANDLRLMSSGPQVGIADIKLPARQAGSSIMPGKVNPVIPEVVNQVAFGVIGNDLTVTMAVEAGQLELNAFEPIIFYKLFESLKTLKGAIYTLRVNCIENITANEKYLSDQVEKSVGLVTALAPHIGYEKASVIAHKALETGESVRDLVLFEGLIDANELDEILDFKKMIQPGILDEDKLL